MKKVILTALCLATCIVANAQDNKDEAPKEGWTRSGNVSLLFNQAAFSNWIAGGQNNISGTLGFNYDFNYVKGDYTWDNKIIAAYGLTKIKDEAFTKKTDDRLEFNSLLGKKAGGYWYYSGFVNFKTQFSKGYEYGTDAVTGDPIRTEITHFFSPAYLQFGPGMLWKKSDNLKVNIAPATARFIFVDKDFTSVPGYVDGTYFGADAGKSSRFEFGASVSGYYKFQLMENVSVENILNFYSNYLEDPQNVDIDYGLNVVMQINKYLSTNLAFQTIYDDNAYKGFQVREVFGLGINYGF